MIIPGKVKIIQRPDIMDDPHDQCAKHKADPRKWEPSRLPLEERKQAYQEARARIFGEADAESEEAQKSAVQQTAQRRAALEMRLAQEKLNDHRDPEYSRTLSCAHYPLGPLSGSSLTFQAAPMDSQAMLRYPRNVAVDLRTVNMDGARAAMTGQQALISPAAPAKPKYSSAVALSAWRAPPSPPRPVGPIGLPQQQHLSQDPPVQLSPHQVLQQPQTQQQQQAGLAQQPPQQPQRSRQRQRRQQQQRPQQQQGQHQQQQRRRPQQQEQLQQLQQHMQQLQEMQQFHQFQHLQQPQQQQPRRQPLLQSVAPWGQ